MRDRRPWRKWYAGKAWRSLRLAQLTKEPYCKYCLERDRKYRKAQVVDHITPHKGDKYLFYDPLNLQSLCKYHHDSDKQREENGSPVRMSFGLDGIPIHLKN